MIETTAKVIGITCLYGMGYFCMYQAGYYRSKKIMLNKMLEIMNVREKTDYNEMEWYLLLFARCYTRYYVAKEPGFSIEPMGDKIPDSNIVYQWDRGITAIVEYYNKAMERIKAVMERIKSTS